VGLYYFIDSVEGGAFCTGSLINNTSNDGKAYFLTAHHCVDTETEANTVVVYWEYESDTCRALGSSENGTPIPKPKSSQSGSNLRATLDRTDFTLLELDDEPEPDFDVYWSGWDRTGDDPSSAVCIHHPKGDAKRISHENDPITTTSSYSDSSPGDGTHFRVADWDSGTTEPGSSGSGLWNSDHRLVGQNHGGDANCSNDLADWYGKISASWADMGSNSTNSLSGWLDPKNSLVNTLDGYEGISPAQLVPAVLLPLLLN